MMIAYTANETHKWKFIEKDNGNNHQSSNKKTRKQFYQPINHPTSQSLRWLA